MVSLNRSLLKSKYYRVQVSGGEKMTSRKLPNGDFSVVICGNLEFILKKFYSCLNLFLKEVCIVYNVTQNYEKYNNIFYCGLLNTIKIRLSVLSRL